MIKYIKRKNLDTKKYDDCIENALNSRVYAFSWYLDIVADNWDVLVLNDYEAVMPLPWRSKYFIKYVYPPAWTQQLGVFSTGSIVEKLMREFVSAIPRKFIKVAVQFNSGNQLVQPSEVRLNYLLSLNEPHEQIVLGFNKNRKRELKKSTLRANLHLNRNLNSTKFLDFFLNQKTPYELLENTKEKLKGLLKLDRDKLLIWGVVENDEVLAALVFLQTPSRIIYLLPVANERAKKLALPTLLINELIKKYSGSELILDFEGSMVPGVASFYKSFGADVERYLLFHKKSIYFLSFLLLVFALG